MSDFLPFGKESSNGDVKVLLYYTNSEVCLLDTELLKTTKVFDDAKGRIYSVSVNTVEESLAIAILVGKKVVFLKYKPPYGE